jgi:hypothetical protein
MRPSARRIAASILVPIALAGAVPAMVAATVTGGCQVTGTSSSGGSIDLTTAAEWHLRKDDVAGGTGTAPSDQTAASVGAYALGLLLPVASGSGDGGTEGSVQGVSVAAYSALGARFLVAGKSDSCSGQVLIIIDDVNPALTVLGGGGIAALVVGALVLLGTMVFGGGILSRIVGLVFGALGGIGLGLALTQFGILDASSWIGLAIVAAGALLGILLPGTLHRREPKGGAPDATAPPANPPADAPA